jgi:metal-responsive CopG/Arc/MetJ family transcriptional regulator
VSTLFYIIHHNTTAMDKVKTQIGAVITKTLDTKLKRLCKRENRNRSEMLRELIRRAK